MEDYRRLLGDNVRKQRELLLLTQEELAHRINKDPSYIGRVERGAVNATLDNILKITQGLQMEPAQLFQKDRPDRLRDYIPDVELNSLDAEQRHMSLVILKVLTMVVNRAEPDDSYALLLRDRMLQTVPFTSYTMVSSHRLIDRHRVQVYGIQATQHRFDGTVRQRVIPELSSNRIVVENLIKRLNNAFVPFAQLDEILEDFIAGDYQLYPDGMPT